MSDTHIVDLPTTVVRVTIYDAGVEVTRQGSVDLPSGLSRIVFEGLPAALDAHSLRVEVAGAEVTLKGVSHELVPVVESQQSVSAAPSASSLEEASMEVGRLEDVMKQLDGSAHFVNLMWQRYCDGGDGPAPTAAADPQDVFAMLDFAVKASDDHRRQLRETAWALEAAQDKLRRLQSSASPRPPRHEQRVSALLGAAKSTDRATVSLSYVTKDASWTPEYEVRVDSDSRAVTLIYNATILQKTPDDWAGVGLTLSTAQPSITGRQPEMQPWRVHAEANGPMPTVADNAMLRSSSIAARPTIVSEAATCDVYTLTGQHDVNRGETLRVTIAQIPLTCELSYVAVPRVEAAAYALATIVNASVCTLLAGFASVFLDGAFVTRTWLQRVAPDESLRVHLGRDDAVAVSHKQLRRRRRDVGSLFGKYRAIDFASEATVRNGKRHPVDVTVRETIPVAEDESITVALTKPTLKKEARDVAMRTGLLEQCRTLNPGETWSLPLEIELTYPSGRDLRGM